MPASEIFIQATATDPEVIARDVVRETHARLRSRLAELTAESQPPAAALADLCIQELRQYLGAAEQVLYRPASGDDGTRLLVDALRVGAAALNAQIDTLATLDSSEAAELVVTIAATLDLHLQIEESVLLPVLTGLPGIDPSMLPADLERHLAGEQVEQAAVIDVRRIARGERHPRILARYARLAPGEAFILVNSHDPKPLRREFEALHGGDFSWDYLQSGPAEWWVRIGRVVTDA